MSRLRLLPLDVSTRSREPELLDERTPPRAELVRIAGFLAFVNRWLGGTRAVAMHLRNAGCPVTVLDVGAGAADVPLALARRVPGVKPMALDRSAAMLALVSGVPRIRGDARALPLADEGVDYAISTDFFHHLSDEEAVVALKEMARVARRGIVVNDLIRNRRALFWIWLFTLFANRYVKNDGPMSVRKAFTVAEIEALARRAGLPRFRVTRHFGHRFTLTANGRSGS